MINWITLDELSQYLKVSRASLYKMAQSGELPAAKIGRNWRFNPEQIDQWLLKSQKPASSSFPWDDALEEFAVKLKEFFDDRFLFLWLYGSWARGDATPESDVDLLIVLKTIQDFAQDFHDVTTMSYDVTFGKNRSVVFSCTLADKSTFLTSLEPLLLNVRLEGKRLA